MEDILKALEKRKKVFKKLIKEEDLKIQKLKHKSRSITLTFHVKTGMWIGYKN